MTSGFADFGTLGALVRWWVGQLVALVPARLLPAQLRGGAEDVSDALIVDAPVPARGFSLAMRMRGRASALGTFGLDDAESVRRVLARRRIPAVLLRLPRELLLEREVTLPAAAEQDLEAVLGYEMDRNTPFTAAEVHFAATVIRRDRARGQITARLSLVARPAIAGLLDALAAAGIAPAAIETGRPPAVRRIALGRPPARSRRLRRALDALIAVLVVAVVAAPFLRTERAISAVDARIDALRPRVDEAEALRRRLASDTTSADAIAAESARLGDALQVLATVTEILPDDTFLTELGLHARKLTVAGQSAAAARLIGLLSADPTIRNPAFTAPVTRNAGGHADLFVLSAEVAP